MFKSDEDVAFATFFEKLLRNEISWRELKDGGSYSAYENAWEVTYQYEQEEKQKDKKDTAMLLQVSISVANARIKGPDKTYYFVVSKEQQKEKQEEEENV